MPPQPAPISSTTPPTPTTEAHSLLPLYLVVAIMVTVAALGVIANGVMAASTRSILIGGTVAVKMLLAIGAPWLLILQRYVFWALAGLVVLDIAGLFFVLHGNDYGARVGGVLFPLLFAWYYYRKELN